MKNNHLAVGILAFAGACVLSLLSLQINQPVIGNSPDFAKGVCLGLSAVLFVYAISVFVRSAKRAP